jgi:hypothetical protein
MRTSSLLSAVSTSSTLGHAAVKRACAFRIHVAATAPGTSTSCCIPSFLDWNNQRIAAGRSRRPATHRHAIATPLCPQPLQSGSRMKISLAMSGSARTYERNRTTRRPLISSTPRLKRAFGDPPYLTLQPLEEADEGVASSSARPASSTPSIDPARWWSRKCRGAASEA